MKKKYLALSTGLALFSMFFGSGNLVFPLLVGKDSSGHFLAATFGLLLTGVVVPLLGAFAMVLFNGNSKHFFGSLGKYAPFWISLVSLALMGPFGVLARCITVAYGSLKLLFPESSLIFFSLISCSVIYFLAIEKKRIVSLLGKILTPVLLLSLGMITACCLWSKNFPAIKAEQQVMAFWNGISQGYQTMDLLAAFFFSAFIIKHLESNTHPEDLEGETLTKIFIKAAMVGGVLLSLVYLCLVCMGSIYENSLNGIPPEEFLGSIAYQSMGPYAAPIVCVAIILACLTTAIVLVSLFANFLQTEISNKLTTRRATLLTLLITFIVSNLEFRGIAKFLAPILEMIYPALIVLTLLNIANKLWGVRMQRWPIALSLIAKLCAI